MITIRRLVATVRKKDLHIETFRVGGAGGQRRDKVSTGVRITHLESGAVGQCTESRMQGANKKAAFRKMAEHPKFKAWVRIKAATDVGFEAGLNRRIDELMRPENLKIEVKQDGKWTELLASTDIR